MFRWIKSLFLFLLGVLFTLFIILGTIFLFFKSISSDSDLGWNRAKDEIKNIENTSCLVINLQQPITEQGLEKFSWGSRKMLRQMSAHDFIRVIRGAQQDERIRAIWLKVDPMFQTSWTIAQDIRNALTDFKKSGKRIYVSADFLSTSQYYLTSVADQLYLTNEGYLLFNGLGVYVSFYKKLLDHLGVEFFVARGRDNDYKSYAEPFMYDKMSAQSREQYQDILKNHWNIIVTEIAASRQITPAAVEELANNVSIFSSKDALDNRLIDAALYEDQIRSTIANSLGDTTADLREVNFRIYGTLV